MSIKNLRIPSTKVQVIILGAGQSERLKAYEPRPLIKIGGTTILERQIEAVSKYFSQCEFIFVGGIERGKMLSGLPPGVRFVENQLYETTNNVESLRLGINNSQYGNILFLHGDLFISTHFFKYFDHSKTCIPIDEEYQIRKEEVGVTVIDSVASCLEYTLRPKWCQMAYFNETDTKILRSVINDIPNVDTMLSYELINYMISHYHIKFNCIPVKNKTIKEIDSLKDLINDAAS